MTCFVIAEAGVNHNGEVDLAVEMVKVAAEAGANAIKFQTYKTQEIVSENTPQCDYQKKNSPENSQYEMLAKYELGLDDLHLIHKECLANKIEFMSTAFDVKSLSCLSNDFSIKRVKIPSGEITNPLLLIASGATKLPIIISTGMSTLFEVEQSIKLAYHGYKQCKKLPSVNELEAISNVDKEYLDYVANYVTLLQCTSSYPTANNEVNLNVMETFKKNFVSDVGFSDHTLGIKASLAAVAKGATIIEKHFTLDKSFSGPDHIASLELNELSLLIKEIRELETMLGSYDKQPTLSEKDTVQFARRKIVTIDFIKNGEKFTRDNIALKRSNNGLDASLYLEIIGSRSCRNFVPGEPVEIE